MQVCAGTSAAPSEPVKADDIDREDERPVHIKELMVGNRFV